jgi:glyoxylase-like metal-dependent hydrolase (beta-lactamase superfamily II)/ferredoxin
MASQSRRLPTNVGGDVYVDESCIDCDTCRWMAPATFDRVGEHSRVHRQPASPEEERRALMALVACPTSSIGTVGKHDLKPILAAFPDLLAHDPPVAAAVPASGSAPAAAPPGDGAGTRAPAAVYHCGFHAEASFGAASYLVVRPGGNVLVDSPRFAAPLVRRLEELGGVATLFLTHQDDVADHVKFAAHFGAVRVLHRGDMQADTAGIERPIDGTDPVALDDELLVLPTPGHTAGSACLLFRERFLFSGDHLAWSERLQHVYGFRDACWHDWDQLVESTRRLQAQRFEWILPGHGRRCHFPAAEMAAQMERCVAWMESVR